MATYFMFGSYTGQALKEISSDRTTEVMNTVKSCGGEVKDVYTLLGLHDVVLITEFPGTEDAMKASIALARLTNIAFSTAPAVSAEAFDKAIGSL